MRKIILKLIGFSFALLITISAYSQQDPIFTQYMNNPVLINPAYAGSYGTLNINGIYRNQWVGLEWQPQTTSLSITSPFLVYQVGVGLTFIHDQTGPISQTGLYLDYAYHIDFDNGGRLSMGLKTGFNYFQKNYTDLPRIDDDPWLSSIENTKKNLFNTGIGFYYFTNNFFLGASVPKLIRNSLNDDENTNLILGREERHLFFTTGGAINFGTGLKFQPTFMVRIVDSSPLSAEATGTFVIKDRVGFGVMYRYGDAIGGHIKIRISNNLLIGYSYDYLNSRLGSFSTGTHELYFSYSIRSKGKRILSPRYNF